MIFRFLTCGVLLLEVGGFVSQSVYRQVNPHSPDDAMIFARAAAIQI